MKQPQRRGFSLIEAAIVLGIIGLVIGGIWVAASAIQINLRAEKLQKFYLNSYETSRGLIRTTLSNTDFTPLFATYTFSAGYTLEGSPGSYWLVGPNHKVFTRVTPASGLFVFRVDFIAGDTSTSAPDPRVCTKFATWLLLDPKWNGSITWLDGTNTDQWVSTDPKPTAEQVVDYCSDAGTLSVNKRF